MGAILNFYEVSDMLACSGQPTDDQLKQLTAEKYQVVVNLGLLNTKYSLPDEAASAKAMELDYHHIPVVFDNPQLDELADFITCMNQHASKKILVHCAANYRASVFTGLYLFAVNKMDEAAMQLFIEEVWQPDAIWQQFIDEGVDYIRAGKD
jgi:protein tyrosine phosphatase (PTP) superfamily phosphohydrolase (DUF442 family)